MENKRTISSRLVWLSLFFLLLGTVTTAIFCLFVAEPDRGTGFFYALSIVIAAELIFFVHLSFMQFAQEGISDSPTPASRMLVHWLIFLWLIVTVIVAMMFVDPENASGSSTSRIFVIDLFITLLFFMSAYFIYQRDLSSTHVTKELSFIRNAIQLNSLPVERMLQKLETIEKSFREHLVLADRVRTKLNTLRTGLDSPLVSERVHSQKEGMWATKINIEISHLSDLDSAIISTPEQAQDFLQQVYTQSDKLISLLQQRQQEIIS